MEKHLVIAIDGVSASGKGAVSKALAASFNLKYLDTGTIYRAVGYLTRAENINPRDEASVLQIAEGLVLENINDLPLRSEEVAVVAATIAKHPQVRKELVCLQRQFASEVSVGSNGVILDGRDIGTVICPNADLKFFLTANLEVRALRRLKQLNLPATDLDQIKNAIAQRDQQDFNLNKAAQTNPGCILVDSTTLTLEETITIFKHRVEEYLARQ